MDELVEEEDTDAVELFESDLDDDCRLLVRDFVLGLAPKDRCVTKESGGGSMSIAAGGGGSADDAELSKELFDVRDEIVLE